MDNMTSLESFIDFCEDMQIEDMDIAEEFFFNKKPKGIQEAEAVKLFEKYVSENKINVFTKSQLRSEVGAQDIVKREVKSKIEANANNKYSTEELHEVKNSKFVLISRIDKKMNLCTTLCYWVNSNGKPNIPSYETINVKKLMK